MPRNAGASLISRLSQHMFPTAALPYVLIDTMKLRFRSFTSQTPLLVYQMGKVGSTAVYLSLKKAPLPYDIYHVHFLSTPFIDHIYRTYKAYNIAIPHHIKMSRLLQKKLHKYYHDIPWKILTLVRDPIGREISSIFHNIDYFHANNVKLSGKPLLDKSSNMITDNLINFLEERFRDFDETRELSCTWFSEEFNPALNVDIFKHSFNQEAGFSIIQEHNFEILLLRLEDLSARFSEALRNFLGVHDDVPLVQHNDSSNKRYAASYRYVLEHLVIPEPICGRIYSSPYVRHFYSEAMITAFIERWSGASDM